MEKLTALVLSLNIENVRFKCQLLFPLRQRNQEINFHSWFKKFSVLNKALMNEFNYKTKLKFCLVCGKLRQILLEIRS